MNANNGCYLRVVMCFRNLPFRITIGTSRAPHSILKGWLPLPVMSRILAPFICPVSQSSPTHVAVVLGQITLHSASIFFLDPLVLQ